MPSIDIWSFIAGLGVFLLGINQMETGIKNLAGKSFRKFLKKYTRNVFSAILLGTLITAILQSSSVVSLMVMAFVGAGIIPLKNAIGVIFGANLGTTITGWIVASIGFKMPIDEFALPLLGVGGLIVTFFSGRIIFVEIGRFLIGFGALFLGLELMKNAVDVESVDINYLSGLNIPDHLFFLIGVLLTAIIQSSSATMAIALSALFTGVISIEIAGAIVIGGYVGTTFTVLLGAIGGNATKKRVAYAHVGFNFVTSIIALIILYPLLRFVSDSLNVNDPLYQLVVFHSLFTLIGILVMFPFVNAYAGLLERFVVDKKQSLCPVINEVPPQVIDGAIEAIKLEGRDLLDRLQLYRYHSFNKKNVSIKKQFFGNGEKNLSEQYTEIKLKEGEIIAYFLEIQKENLNGKESEELQAYIHAVKRLSLATKNIDTVQHTIAQLLDAEEKEFVDFKNIIQEQYTKFYDTLKINQDPSDLIYNAYRDNVNVIYDLIEKKILSKKELTSYLHLNSQIKQFKENFYEAWLVLNEKT